MNKTRIFFIFIFILFILSCQQQTSNLDYVDPSIGGVGVVLEPTRPTVHLPNSMVRVFPNRKDQLDDQIDDFFLTIASHRLQKVFSFMPVNGEPNQHIWFKSCANEHEVLRPYYYSTEFEDSGNSIQFSPKTKSGFYKINFAGNQPHFLQMGTFFAGGEINMESKNSVSGTEHFEGMNAFFYAETNKEIQEVLYQNSNDKRRLMLSFGNEAQEVKFKYGISFISIEQAKQNLQNEIPDWDFERVKNDAKKEWEKVLSQINVKGGTEAQKRVFYTALYRSYERMVDINEYGLYFSGFDNQVHESDNPFYVDNWIWDNYIALEPLFMILNPKMATERIQSYIKMYEQGGTMPSFALVFGDWPAMTGNFAAAWMADAWYKGLLDFNLKTAYEGLKKNSLESTLLPWRNGPKSLLDDFYNEHGFMPGLYPGETETVPEVSLPWERRQAVSVTIENSYSDWCLAQLAKELNLEKDNKLFLERARFYQNVFRVDRGFMWPRDTAGNWIEPYDPRFADRMYFTENNAYTYNWSVKHDLNGLFGLMNKKHGAEATLDQLFREDLGLPKWQFWNKQPDASGLVGQFVMGNEPGFHIPYIYNYLGAPWKTQKRIRMLLDAFYTDNLFGIPGDEDGGGMSAFVVFSMMGFFQVTSGIPVYSIGSPVFEEITINLSENKQFKIIAQNCSKENKYIQQAFFNGEELNQSWFTHQQLMNGGTLKLIMGNRPNKKWGSEKETLPPSSIDFYPGNIK